MSIYKPNQTESSGSRSPLSGSARRAPRAEVKIGSRLARRVADKRAVIESQTANEPVTYAEDEVLGQLVTR